MSGLCGLLEPDGVWRLGDSCILVGRSGTAPALAFAALLFLLTALIVLIAFVRDGVRLAPTEQSLSVSSLSDDTTALLVLGVVFGVSARTLGVEAFGLAVPEKSTTFAVFAVFLGGGSFLPVFLPDLTIVEYKEC